MAGERIMSLTQTERRPARAGYDTKALAEEKVHGLFYDFVRAFLKNRMAIVGAFVLAVITLAAVFAPAIAHDPNKIRLLAMKLPPGSEGFLLGTDELGREVLSRLLFGARVSLMVGIFSALVAVTIGTTIGAIAGYYGGKTDAVLMRIVDGLMCLPTIFLVIIISAYILKTSVWHVIMVIGVTGWMSTSRLVRGQILAIKQQDYVEAARALGLSNWHIIRRYILPNVLSPVIVAGTLAVAYSILYESALSYLGLGVQPPTASWGNMLHNAQDIMYDAWWLAFFPGLMIFVTVFCVNLIGDGLRDALDPRLKNTK